MITSLEISNYALIDKLVIAFGPGLNIITGETGAGKSILLGALSLIMGERAETRTIRDASRKTIVEAEFEYDSSTAIDTLLADNDIDVDSGHCILRREVTTKGGSRAFINDTPVNLTLLKTVGLLLLDIHSQHQNRMLVDTDFQLRVIDAWAGNKQLLEEYSKAFRQYRRALKEFSTVRETLKRSESESEYIAYQLKQLDELNLQKGELEQLEHDRDIIANSAQIKVHLNGALDALTRSDNSVMGLLSRAENELHKLAEVVEEVASLAERLESTRIEVADIIETLNEYDNSMAVSPEELENIERRLGEIYALQTKHRIDDGDGLIALREEFRQKLADIGNSDEVLADLEDKARRAKKTAVMLARQLSERRVAAAMEFAAELKSRAMPMGMKNLRFEVRLNPGKLTANGMDEIDFLFAFNKNQPLMPVGKTASGGEISRIILALKSLMVEKMQLPTIIFDEVDTGVSGDIANRMAALMLEIAESTQVITITHLATVAARGSKHFKVYKEDENESTNTHIRLLDDNERAAELALMISGNASDEAALANARALLNTN